MKTIFFHIGQTKTATTTLQTFCSKNRGWLARKGILYPLVPKEHPLKIQHRFLVQGFHKSKGNFGQIKKDWDFIKQQIDSSKLDKVLISEEVFWHLFANKHELRTAAIKWIKNFLSDYDVKLICYLRRQDSWIESWYNQLVKTDVTKLSRMSIGEFVDFHRDNGMMDYFEVLSDWEKEFGAVNMTVKAFEKGQWLNGDIIEDFLSLLSINDLRGAFMPDDKQVSLTNPACAFSAVFNRAKGAEAAKTRLQDMMVRMSENRKNVQRFLPRAVAEKLLSSCAESNRMVAKQFMQGRTELFDNRDLANDYEDYPGLSVEELAEIVAYMFIDKQAQLTGHAAPRKPALGNHSKQTAGIKTKRPAGFNKPPAGKKQPK